MLKAPVPIAGLADRAVPAKPAPRRPVIGVGAVVVHDSRVLLVRRANPPRQGEWSLPGGRQRLGETVFAAAEREVREETGITVRVRALVDVVDFIDRDIPDGPVRFHYTLVDVVAEWLAGDPEPGDDAAEAAWIALADLPTMDLWSETRRVIRLAEETQCRVRAASAER